jgi:predicted CXXCH cytochrome family protein
MGCTTCHAVANVKGATYITLTSPSNQLCFTCHTVSTDTVQHPPYKEGNCVFCHSPHASNFPAHMYASPQDVCMACHVRGLMKVNRKAHTLTLSWGATIPFKEMDSWFYLNLNKTHKLNHPVEGHPVSGPNVALGKDSPPITCLTCHEPHHSTVANLILPKYKTTTSLCESCHRFPI